MIRDGRQAHPLYHIWRGMFKRCNQPSAVGFKNYGGRGIKVSPVWSDFWRFVSDVGPRPSDQHQLDRINNDGDYEPSNIRWATSYDQCRNARYNKVITINGASKIMSDWAKDNHLPKSTVFNRLKRGWPVEAAVTMPTQTRGKRVFSKT